MHKKQTSSQIYLQIKLTNDKLLLSTLEVKFLKPSLRDYSKHVDRATISRMRGWKHFFNPRSVRVCETRERLKLWSLIAAGIVFVWSTHSGVFYNTWLILYLHRLNSDNTYTKVHDTMNVKGNILQRPCKKIRRPSLWNRKHYSDYAYLGAWIADFACQTSTWSTLTLNHRSHRGTKTCIPGYEKWMSHVCNLEVRDFHVGVCSKWSASLVQKL